MSALHLLLTIPRQGRADRKGFARCLSELVASEIWKHTCLQIRVFATSLTRGWVEVCSWSQSCRGQPYICNHLRLIVSRFSDLNSPTSKTTSISVQYFRYVLCLIISNLPNVQISKNWRTPSPSAFFTWMKIIQKKVCYRKRWTIFNDRILSVAVTVVPYH